MKLDTYIKNLQKIREKYGNVNLVYSVICDCFTNSSLTYFPLTYKPRYKAKCNYTKQKKDKYVTVTEPVVVIN